MSTSLLNSFIPLKNASNNLVAPAKGGAIATNFLIFFKNAEFALFFNKLVKAKLLP